MKKDKNIMYKGWGWVGLFIIVIDLLNIIFNGSDSSSGNLFILGIFFIVIWLYKKQNNNSEKIIIQDKGIKGFIKNK